MDIRKHIIYCASLVAFLMGSCSNEEFFIEVKNTQNDSELRLQAVIDQENLTRASDSGFADGDRIGIYVVNFKDGMPGTLLSSGNLATNVGFKYDEAANSWNGDRAIYFADDKTPVDVYGVYPYVSDIEDVENYEFSVGKDQSIEADGNSLCAYEASDFLWGKTAGVTSENPIITVGFQHILSGVAVTLLEGYGFGEGEWEALKKEVFVGGTIRTAAINLAEGKATVQGETDGQPITPAKMGDRYRAVVIPQKVNATTPLLLINVGDESYSLVKDEAMEYVPSRLHKFTVKVDKKPEKGDYVFSLVKEAVTMWENDEISHDGAMREYLTLHVEDFGGIAAAVEDAGLSPKDVKNLKITGRINSDDLGYIRDNFTILEAINLKEATVKGRIFTKWEHITPIEQELMDKYNDKENTLDNDAFIDMIYLRYVVLPDNIKAIGNGAFRNTALTGTINLPEGLEFIGDGAIGISYGEVDKKSLTGELRLPSTLEYIWGGAFTGTDFSGELILPARLKYLGENAFARCHYLKGELHLPDKLEYIGDNAFSRAIGISGRLVYPNADKVVKPVAGSTGIESVRLPEAPEEFGFMALCDVPLRGDLHIPASVRKFNERSLSNTKLSHIIFDEGINVDHISSALMHKNKFLIDTITFPASVESIGNNALSECDKLDAVVIPKKVHTIGDWAFAGCSSLTYIRCDAVDPPSVNENAFEGINKDNFTLEVPEGCVDKYRAARGWKEFKRIAVYKNFVARPLKYNVLNKGGEREIVLNADAAWEVTEIPSWCHIDKTAGNKKASIKLNIDEMAHNAGDRQGKIIFRLSGDECYETAVTVSQYDYEHEEDSYLTLQTATKGNGINLFLVGDGYDAIDISEGRMLADMREEMEFFFGVEPYTTYRDYFNVYCGIALSDDSGVEDVNHWRKTKFHTIVSNSDTRLETDWQGAMNYVAEICPPLSASANPQAGVILVANTPIYEGITYSTGDSFCAVVTRSEYDYPYDARGIIQHEAGGHGIGWLGDEYMYHRHYIQDCVCTCCHHVNELINEQANGFALNISLKGTFRTVPWAHLINHESYSDIVDIYEGGYFHGQGVFRPEYNSCMNNNIPYFSTWSRQLIVERIMKLSGGRFTLNDFYSNDRRGLGKAFAATRTATTVPPGGRHGRAPVMVKNFKFGKKGGRK